MKFYLLLPFVVATIHLIGTYLRYLPFAEKATPQQKRRLFATALCWAFLGLILQPLLIWKNGINFVVYKQIVLFGVLPYFLFGFFILRGPFYQHIFILGMQHIFSFSLHVLSSVIALLLFEPVFPEYILIQSALHITTLFLLLPFASRWFAHLLLPFYEDSSGLLNYTLAFIPLLAVASHWYMVFAPAPEVISTYLSRLIICLCFFLFYRYCWMREREIREEELRREENFFMQYQIESLTDYTHQILENQSRAQQLRHDSRHWLRMLNTMLESENYIEAKKMLLEIDSQLDRTALYPYCQNPLINAALSIYFSRAKKYGIQLQQSVSLPPSLPGMDNDIAILLSNLLDNAIHACLQGKDSVSPHISLTIQTKGSQIALHLENSFAGKLALDKEGFPVSPRKNLFSTTRKRLRKIVETEKRNTITALPYLQTKHGIGTLSIKSFIQKYKAYYHVTQKDNIVSMLMYWTLPTEKIPAESPDMKDSSDIHIHTKDIN